MRSSHGGHGERLHGGRGDDVFGWTSMVPVYVHSGVICLAAPRFTLPAQTSVTSPSAGKTHVGGYLDVKYRVNVERKEVGGY